MARPLVADGGTASNTEDSCEYIELAVADSRQGPAWRLGEVLITPRPCYETDTFASDLDWTVGTT